MSSTLISLLKADEAKKRMESEKPKLEVVPKTEQPSSLEKLPEIERETGRPDAQTVDVQTSNVDVQSPKTIDVQSPKTIDAQTSIEKFYPSRKHKKRKTIRLPSQKVEKYELWCFMNKIDFQDAVERAMDYFIGRPDAHILINDIDEDKETDEIIIFYRKWTGNKIKPKDRTAREEVKRFSDDICKIGILTAISRTKNKINSFAYCVPVIEDVAEEAGAIESKGDYLKHLETFILGVRKGSKQI
jgi:hypothetical protein